MSRFDKEKKMMFICWLAYAVAYIGRLNYSASIVAIISEMGITKAEAGLVSSFFFFAYGLGQLVNGILSKHYNGRIMVFFSLAISSVLNVAMPLCGNIAVMKYIWMLNGAVQSVLWCTLIKTISEHVSDKNMPKAVVVMSTPTAAGTFIVYGLSAFFVKFINWKATFYFAAVALAVTACVWFVLFGNDKGIAKETEADAVEKVKAGKPIIIVFVTVALAGIANGFIKDGIHTWVPNVLYEEFGVSESLSILLTLLLPLISMVGAMFVKKIHEKIKSLSCLDVVFYVCSVLMCGVILVSLKLKNIVILMIAFIAVACLMAMINNVITSIFALENRKKINSGFAAGFLNTFCYVGSTITSYSLGIVSESKGWNAVFLIMTVASVAAAFISLVGMKFDRRLSE